MNTKQCNTCNKIKDLSEYYATDLGGKLMARCKCCKKRMLREAYARDMAEDPILTKRKMMLQSAKVRAKKKGIDYNIELEDVCDSLVCPVTGQPLIWDVAGNPQANSPSLDRIDSTKGYIKGNVKVIAWWANALKNDVTFEQMEQIYNYMSINK